MTTTSIASWQWAWREGVAPHLSTAGLAALQDALEHDDAALIQGQNVQPPPLQIHEGDPVSAACAIGLAAWKGDYQGSASVAEVDSRVSEICARADHRLGEPAGVRFFLTQYDSWSRAEMRRNLLTEVGLALAERAAKPAKKMASSIDQEIDARQKIS
jgi:hypothetical protein